MLIPPRSTLTGTPRIMLNQVSGYPVILANCHKIILSHHSISQFALHLIYVIINVDNVKCIIFVPIFSHCGDYS